MEQQFREMQAVVEELQGELAERDGRLAAYQQEGGASPVHERASVSMGVGGRAWHGLRAKLGGAGEPNSSGWAKAAVRSA